MSNLTAEQQEIRVNSLLKTDDGLSGSDKSIKDGTSPSIVVAKKKQYRDLDLSLAIHPIRKDIIPLVDDRAIANAIKNLLISNFNERPFQPTTGANLRGRLFEPNDAITRIGLRNDIRRCIQNNEPRVSVNGINIQDDIDRNSYKITVFFLIKEFDTQESIDIELRRLR
jgi:phage baseplate assembly protein W